MVRCAECDSKRKIVHDDPRQPPLAEGPCLCRECFGVAATERVAELWEEINSLISEIVG